MTDLISVLVQLMSSGLGFAKRIQEVVRLVSLGDATCAWGTQVRVPT